MAAGSWGNLRGLLSGLVVLWGSVGLMACATDSGTVVPEAAGVELYRLTEEVLKPDPGPEELPELGESATLEDFLRYAALNNAGLKAAFENWKAALFKIPQVQTLPDPRFTYAYFIEEVETRVGPQRQKFALAQTFPWLSKLSLRGDVAAQQANVERARYEAAREKLFFQVKKTYFEYYFLGRSIVITRENLELLKFLETVGRTQYAAALGPYSDVVRVQVELGKLEDRLRTLDDLQAPTASMLNAALSRPADAPVAWPKSVPAVQMALDDVQVIDLLVRSSPELKALAFAVEKEKKAIELAAKEYYPDLTLGLEAVDTGPAEMGSPADSGKDPVAASFSINVPIWLGKYRAGARESEARHAAAAQALTERRNTLIADGKMALYGYRDAERKIDLYRDGLLPKARQSLEVSLQGFEAGIGSFLAVIDAQRTLLEFELSLERALTDRAERLAELDRLVGEALPRVGIQSQG